MKASVLLLVLSLQLFGLKLFAQQNFEGKISYSMQPEGNDETPYADVYLKGTKMLYVNVNERNKTSPRQLFDFSKGICYILKQDDSTALAIKLIAMPYHKKDDTGSDNNNTTSILNYRSQRISYSIDSFPRTPFKDIDAWFSEELVFRVPDSVRFLLSPFILLNDNSISLRSKVWFKEKMTEGAPANFTVAATLVSREALSDAVFEIPAFYKIKEVYYSNPKKTGTNQPAIKSGLEMRIRTQPADKNANKKTQTPAS